MMRYGRATAPSGFIEPCILTAARVPPSGPGWLHEIKHHGYRLMACLPANGARPRRRHMHEFKITLARIEEVEEGEQGKQICAVFHIERGLIRFHVPIYMRASDFDNSEMVQAAKNSLHRMFIELAKQSKVWELSPAELKRLSKISLRPTK
jgi:hypothetical protein